MDDEGIGHDAKTARKIKNNCQGTLGTMGSMGNNQQNQERSKVSGATVGEKNSGLHWETSYPFRDMFGSAMNQNASPNLQQSLFPVQKI